MEIHPTLKKIITNRSLPYCLLALCCLSALLWLTSSALSAQQPDTPDIVARGDVTQRQLWIGGRVVLEKAGSHFGRPAISPDGRMLAISVIPTGTETDGYAQLYLYTLPGGTLVATVPGHSPAWQADSRALVVESRSGRLVYDVTRKRSIAEPVGPAELEAQSTIPPIPSGPQTAPDYPKTIRVAHHPENACRDVADWQVDVIPFEEYVARSVPAEVPVSWALDALAAQAVAARTYAWYQIRQNRPTYDVTDWANFQMMCDQRYPASDQAVAMTAGQYLSYQGDSLHAPIIAMYSAMNSHPTLDNPAVPYLRAVPDPTGLGEERWGHGYGLSQWGAARRARAGQSYRQILGYYFTAVNLQNALDPSQLIAGLLGPIQNGYLPVGGLRWDTLSSFTAQSGQSGQLVVSSSSGLTRTHAITSTQSISYTDVITHSGGLTETVTLTHTTTLTETVYETDPVTLPGNGVWQQPLEMTDGAQVIATLYLSDTVQESVSLWVDRTPPLTPTLILPASTDSLTITLAAAAPAGAVLGLSNDWRWKGETLLRSIDSGSVVSDGLASAGAALEARVGSHTPGQWYGPYTNALPPAATYRALFRLRAGDHPARSSQGVLPDRPIARLDVADQMGTVRLGLRDIWASDFAAPDQYQEIPVDFHIFEPAQGIEFRVEWYGDVTLALDRVWVFQLQEGGGEGEQSRLWRLGGGNPSIVQAMSYDAAANASPVISRTVAFVDDGPPIFGGVNAPTGWQTELPITMTTTVQDRVSGLDGTSGVLLLGDESYPARLDTPGNPWAEQRLVAVLTDGESPDGESPVADGIHSARFRIADQAGTAQESPAFSLKIDRTQPEMAAGATLTSGEPISSPHGWYGGPVLVQIDASDATSGLSGVAFILDNAPFTLYAEPFLLAKEGWHIVRYWAQDMAGNYHYSEYFEAGIDTTPPTVWARLNHGDTDSALAIWGGDDALSGVAGFRVEVRRGDGDWLSLLPEGEGVTEETGLSIPVEKGEEIEIRVQAVDRVGNSNEWQVAGLASTSQLFLPSVSSGQ